MWGRRFAAIAVFVCLAGVAAGSPSTSIPPANQPLTGPQATLERLAQAFRDRAPDALDALFTSDYVFHAVGDSRLGHTEGSDRESEMQSFRSMLTGVVRNGVTVLAAADSVGMRIDGIREGVDPEHPDSTRHYRVETVARFEFGFRLTNGNRLENSPSVHVFHLVRGDAAKRVSGQTASAEKWYIRRWLEDVSGVRKALAEQKGNCGEQEPTARAAGGAAVAGGLTLPGMLGIRALTNPACSALRVSCDLPGSEPAQVEVYDVSGRLVNTRQVAVKEAGNISVDAGAGAHLLPGIYWVRLGQAARKPSTRMVVVAR